MKKKKKEITKGYFLGDTVLLKEETEFSKKNGFKLNDIGIVSKSDTKESLQGWKVIDYEKRISEIVDNMEPEKIVELYKGISEMMEKAESVHKNKKNSKK
jgi:hypothetical protein